MEMEVTDLNTLEEGLEGRVEVALGEEGEVVVVVEVELVAGVIHLCRTQNRTQNSHRALGQQAGHVGYQATGRGLLNLMPTPAVLRPHICKERRQHHPQS